MLECWRADPAQRSSFRDLDEWFSRFWEVTDTAGLYAIGYSRGFCRRAVDERGGAIRDTAKYLYADEPPPLSLPLSPVHYAADAVVPSQYRRVYRQCPMLICVGALPPNLPTSPSSSLPTPLLSGTRCSTPSSR